MFIDPDGQRAKTLQASRSGDPAGVSPPPPAGSPPIDQLWGDMDDQQRSQWFAHMREGWGDHLMVGYATVVEHDRSVWPGEVGQE